MKKSSSLKMIKIALSIVMIFGAISCSEDANFIDANNQLQEETLLNQDALRTVTPIAPWGSSATWDDNAGVLRTALWLPPALGATLPNYSFTQFPAYDFSPYYLNGETEYNPANYDLMAHFGYISPEAVTDAVVEFTFPQIKYFLPHMNNANQQRIYTVNNIDNQTVITCTTNLIKGMNPMFCFLVKVDCGKGKSGFATIWSEMKVNGISVKGTIKNKVFECN
jgi:hypothetical protein